MAFVHGKNTVVNVDGTDISDYTNACTWSPEVDEHDVTTYGKEAHNYQGGLFNGQATLGGIFDSAASGTPAVALLDNLGDKVTFIYEPAGTGTGLPRRTGTVLVRTYEESAPVADMVSWTATLRFSSKPVDSVQS